MKTIFLLVAFLAVVLCVPNCDNPVVQSYPSLRFWGLLEYAVNPEAYQGSKAGVCSDFLEADSDTCCSDRAYEKIEAAFNGAVTELQTTVTEARKLLTSYDSFKDAYARLEQSIDDDEFDRKEERKEAVRKILAALDNFLSGFIDNYASCASSVLRYWHAFMCFGCEPNWEDYLFKNADNFWRIKLDQSRCDDLVDGCGGFFQLFTDLANDIQDALKLGFPNFEPAELENPCDGECQEFICKSLVAGSNYDDKAVTEERKRNIISSYSQIEKHTSPEFVRFMGNAHHTAEQLSRAFQRRNDANSDFGENTYTDDGSGFKFDNSKSTLQAEISASSQLHSFLWWL